MLITFIEDPAVTVQLRTVIKALFLYFVYFLV